MGNDRSKATFVVQEPDERVLPREEHDAAVAERAVEGIHEAERVSGFGRFATSVQNVFQQSHSARTNASGQWRAAPVVISAGLLLALAVGLLIVLSKPADQASRGSRQTQGLAGPDDNKPVAGSPYAPPPVTENQLVGGEAATTEQLKKANPAAARIAENTPMWRQPGPAYAEPVVVAQSSVAIRSAASTELQSPATVFVAGPVSKISPETGLRSQEASGTQPLQLPSGTEIAAHTTNSISSGLDSPVVAVVDRNVELNGVIG